MSLNFLSVVVSIFGKIELSNFERYNFLLTAVVLPRNEPQTSLQLLRQKAGVAEQGFLIMVFGAIQFCFNYSKFNCPNQGQPPVVKLSFNRRYLHSAHGFQSPGVPQTS